MREMKNSGIEWIGDIPSDWDIIPHKVVMHKQKDICEHYNGENIISLTMGGVVVRDLTAGGKMPTTFDGYQYVEEEDLLLCLFDIDVTPRCVGVVRNNGITSPAYSRFKVHNGFYNCFYDYLLRSIDNDKVFVHLSKNLRSSLTETDFGAIKTIAPSFNKQKKIADFLDKKCAEIDTVIEKTKATIEEYKKLKQSVITQAVTKGIRPNRPMKDSGIEWIGEIPADWSVRKLKTFTTQISKGATPKDMSTEKTDFYSIRFLKSENIVDNQLISVPEFYIEESIHSGELKRSQLSDNDIMFVIAGASIGKVAIVSNELLPANTNQAMSFIRVLEKYKEIKKYLWYVLQSDIMKLFITLYSVQSAQPNISMENLGNFRLCVPADFQEIKDILLYLNIKCLEIDELITKKTSLLSELESYKKSLIYEYVTGKKEV